MVAVERWKITWTDPNGFEIEGWYNGSERNARRFARECMADLGALGYALERGCVR